MSQRGIHHAGWRHLDCILGGRGVHQRVARSLCHQTVLLNFIKTLTEVTEAAAPGGCVGRAPEPALLPSWLPDIRPQPGVSPTGGRRLPPPRPPPPAPPPKLALPGLMPEGERAPAVTWLPRAGAGGQARAVLWSRLPGTGGASAGEPPGRPDSPSLRRAPNLPSPQ